MDSRHGPGPGVPDLLRLIDERSTAFRAAIASAPSLDAQIPGCPGWTLFDLAQHLGRGHAPGVPPSAPDPEPLLEEAALDGVEEFLFTCCATTSAWPHESGRRPLPRDGGPVLASWLSAEGARAAPISPLGTDQADASARATAGEIVLLFYGRLPLDALHVQGDRRVFEELIAWEPE